MHNTFFDVDFVKTDQNEVGTSRMKLLMHHNVEPVGVEPDRCGGFSAEGVSETPKGGSRMVEGGSEPAEGASQPPKHVNRMPECASFSLEGACEPSDALLLLAAPNSGVPSNERKSEASDSTFDDESDLHKGQFFSSKKK